MKHEKNSLATWIPIGVGVGLVIGLIFDKARTWIGFRMQCWGLCWKFI
ncbi:hypothetical protein MX850_01975 [Erysipelothrix sp. Poltava]|nr:hypothetical protein MX850_01975 [Erysipelothrix sp. Poltava]